MRTCVFGSNVAGNFVLSAREESRVSYSHDPKDVGKDLGEGTHAVMAREHIRVTWVCVPA